VFLAAVISPVLDISVSCASAEGNPGELDRLAPRDHDEDMAVLAEREALRRLYDRFGFGLPPGELDTSKDFATTLDRFLAPAVPGADAGVRATPAPRFAAPPPRPGKADPATKKQDAAQQRDQERQLVLWWLDRMVAADVATSERLTWFWHGHFATGAQKVRDTRLMLAQNETQRRLSAGGFRAIAQAMIVDPAMLLWLDGSVSKVGSPNENLAREFMELFTLGVGHYTESDVREAARALTGWTVRRPAGTADFVGKRHDDGPEQILGVTESFDTQSFVDTVLARTESAPFIVGRLWFRLVSATPPAPETVTKLVSAYGPGRDVSALLRAIAEDPAFHDSATTLVKQPVEWLAGLMRALGVRPSLLDGKSTAQLLAGLRAMGQTPFAPPSVGGWAAGGAWLSTSAGVARLQLAQLVAGHCDLSRLSAASNRVDAVAELLGVGSWSDRTRNALAGLTGDPKRLSTVAACAPEYVVSR
jgi:uncharacterized protein (DUF1800 family)